MDPDDHDNARRALTDAFNLWHTDCDVAQRWGGGGKLYTVRGVKKGFCDISSESGGPFE